MTSRKRNKLIAKIIVSCTFTFAIIELSGTISQLIDGIVISNVLGGNAMAAYGLAAPYFYMISMFSGIIAVGLQSALSAAMSSGNRNKLTEALSAGIWGILIISIVITALGLSFSAPLCRFLGASEVNASLFDELHSYTVAWFIGVPGFVAFTVISPIVVLDGNKNCLRCAVITQAVINGVGDLLAAYVWKNGLFGIALATSLDFYAATLVLLTSFLRRRTMLPLRIRRFNPKEFFTLVRCGLPILTQRACRVVTPMVVNRVILAIGSVAAMTARSVQDNLSDFLLVLGVGIAESLRLVAQVLFSEEDRDGLRQTVHSTLRLFFPLIGGFCILIALIAPFLAKIYLSPADEGFMLLVQALRIFSIYIFLRSFNDCLTAYIHAAGRMRLAHFHTFSSELLFIVPCVILLGRQFGPLGLYAAYPVSEAITILAFFIVMVFESRKTSLREKSEPDGENELAASDLADRLMMIPAKEKKAHDIVFDIAGMDDVIGISLKVSSFCQEFGIDRRRSFYASLCVEELAGNIVQHGFYHDSDQHNCSVRLIVNDDVLKLRFSDDCRYFDLCKRYESLDTNDPCAGIGIRMVYGIAKDVQYVNILNTNTLTITL